MELEFKFVDKQHIKIIAVVKDKNIRGKDMPVRHEVGEIFTPSGSGNDKKDAIQICGFTEAFDLWGCGNYTKPKWTQDTVGYKYHKDGSKMREQCKDIQLWFDIETVRQEIQRLPHEDKGGCLKCYNEPCTCEVKIKAENPYTVKRLHDIEPVVNHYV